SCGRETRGGRGWRGRLVPVVWEILREATADFFGEELAAPGFNYHGNGPMYGMITGQEFKADIYIGDRLMHCSDNSQSHVCRLCGSILSPIQAVADGALVTKTRGKSICKTCRTGDGTDGIAVPYVFRHLHSELIAMNVRLKLEIS
ncbi:hypothetical protein BDK51DRAFT_29266, partial [Blyttiomyces helicus]